MAKPEARLVYVGKEKGYHSRTQEEIHELLLQFAEAGALTVRLKGGDPFVFGRGAEESQYLEQRGVCVRIIPGITAAAGISALLGVPLTHRGVATSVRFVTGHAREGGADELDQTIAAAADPATTLVVYMGLSTLPKLVQQLVSGGADPDTPAVAVERGTTPDSRICHGRLADLPHLTLHAQLRSPTLIIIGEVVALSPGWRMWEVSGEPVVMPGPPLLPVDLAPYQSRRQDQVPLV
jgi:uroporphyrin-III C-methyltransferase